MVTDMVFNTAGGLGLFLYGMGLMSDGLKKAAGQKMRKLLESMTQKPLMGFATGIAVTALVQSSSATTVMLIGLVNAGLMTLKQAICVIFGTNVGTTVTAWLVAVGINFKISSYALPAVGIGFLMTILCKTRKSKSIGQVILGFGVLFIGIGFMKDAFAGLEKSQAVVQWLASFGGKPILALIAGTVITMLIQSSSASIAIVQLLAINGAFGPDMHNALNVAIPFVLGSNIGTTITAQIASLRTNTGARRTAMAHTMFNVVGSAIALPFVYTGLFGKFVTGIIVWELSPMTIAKTIAIAHTAFNVGTSILCLPFAALLEKLVVSVVRARRFEDVEKPVVLEEHLLDTPSIALQQAKREMVRMAEIARTAVNQATEGLIENDIKKIELTRKTEDMVDEYQHEITSYLVRLSQRQLNDEVSVELPVLLHTVNDLERIGDHAVNIAEIAERKAESKITFSDTAGHEADKMISEVQHMFNEIITSLQTGSIQTAHKALSCEKQLNRMQVTYRRTHVQRMTDGACSAEAGLIFIDLIDNIEKIGDHLTNIAQSVVGGLQWYGITSNTLSGEFEAIQND